MPDTQRFQVGITGDFRAEAALSLEPVLAEMFGPLPFVEYRYMEPSAEVAPAQITGLDAVISLRPRFTAATFTGAQRLAVIARWGVGYDMIDVPACTQANVLLAITTDAVRKPVAEAILTLLLALAKRLPAKERLVRMGRWEVKGAIPGSGLAGKTVGSVGLGNIAGEMFRLLNPFDLGRRLAYDPYIPPVRAAALRVDLVDLPTLFAESDFVTINCPLNDQTRGLVDAHLISLMKPTAYLINTARGAIVNERDLIAALKAGRIAGAGLDVFEQEPLPLDSPLLQLDNVILTPHALAWTDDMYRGSGLGVCENVLTVLRGEVPKHIVNRGVVTQPGFQAKLRALRERWTRLAGQ